MTERLLERLKLRRSSLLGLLERLRRGDLERRMGDLRAGERRDLPPPLCPLPPPRDLPWDSSTLARTPQIFDPSRDFTASSASLESSNSTKANPGGRLATQTFRIFPYRRNASSISSLLASSGRPPMYTLPSTYSLRRDMLERLER